VHGAAERRPFQVVVGGAGEPVTLDGAMLQRPYVAAWQIAVVAVAAAVVIALLLLHNSTTTQLKSAATNAGGAGGTATSQTTGGGTTAAGATGPAAGAATSGTGSAAGGPGGAGATIQPLTGGQSSSSTSSAQRLTSTSTSRVTSTSTTAQFSQPFKSLPGSAAAVAAWGGDRLDVFTRGGDQQLWHAYWAPGWGGWEPLGGVLNSDPAVASWGPNRLDVFVRGQDNALWHKWYDGNAGGWQGSGCPACWESLGGGITMASAPSVASWGSGRLDVFARGSDNALWHMWFDASGWHGFERLGGNLVSAPAAASWGPGRIDVVAVQRDGRLYDMVYDASNGGWHPFALIGTNQPVAGDPSLSSQGAGELDLMIDDPSNDAVIHLGYNGGWASRWDAVGGGILSSGPRSTSWANGRLDAFGRGTNGDVWHAYWAAPGPWSGWSDCGLPDRAQTPYC
jgi:hypothetical protein